MEVIDLFFESFDGSVWIVPLSEVVKFSLNFFSPLAI